MPQPGLRESDQVSCRSAGAGGPPHGRPAGARGPDGPQGALPHRGRTVRRCWRREASRVLPEESTDHVWPRDVELLAAREAVLPHPLRGGLVLVELVEDLSESLRVRLRDASLDPVPDELERTAGVLQRHDRLRGVGRLERGALGQQRDLLVLLEPPEAELDLVLEIVLAHVLPDLEDKVELRFGWLEEDEKVALLAQCPSLEASHSAKAIVTLQDSGGALEFVRDGIEGRVAEPNPQALAQVFDQLYEDKAAAERMGQHSFARREELNIAWPHVIRRLLGEDA